MRKVKPISCDKKTQLMGLLIVGIKEDQLQEILKQIQQDGVEIKDKY